MVYSTTAQLLDMMAARDYEDPLDKLAKQEYLADMVQTVLTPKERHVILKYFYQGESLEAIGKMNPDRIFKKEFVSRQYVETVKRKAIKKIYIACMRDLSDSNRIPQPKERKQKAVMTGAIFSQPLLFQV